MNLEWDKSGQQVYVPRHKIVSTKQQQTYPSAELVGTDDKGAISSGSTERGDVDGADRVVAGEAAATMESAAGAVETTE